MAHIAPYGHIAPTIHILKITEIFGNYSIDCTSSTHIILEIKILFIVSNIYAMSVKNKFSIVIFTYKYEQNANRVL